MDQDNVIVFPKIHRMHEGKESRFETEQRKVLVTASIASIAFLMTLANYSLFQKSTAEVEFGSRSIASIEIERNTDWEHSLAKKLSGLRMRALASVGQTPSTEEKLRYEVLQGKYAVRYSNDKTINEIELIERNGQNRPKAIADYQNFLQSYRSLMPSFDLLVPVNTGDKKSQAYKLVKGNTKVALVNFSLDKYGRLLSMKVDR